MFLCFIFYCYYFVRVIRPGSRGYCVSSRTGGDGSGNSFAIPIGWSGGYIGDFTLTPGQTPVASGIPGSYSDTVGRAGGYVNASDRGTGTSGGHFGAPTRLSGDLVGLRRMSGASAARNMAHPSTRRLRLGGWGGGL